MTRKYNKRRFLKCGCGKSFATNSPRTEGLLCPVCAEKRRLERRKIYDELDNKRRRTGRLPGRPRAIQQYLFVPEPAKKEVSRFALPSGFAPTQPGRWRME